MSSAPPDPYVKTNPGDLITAQLFNGVQSKIKEDIAKKVADAINAITQVDQAKDASTLGGKTPKELEDEIIEKALAILPTRTGYEMIFKRLTKGDEKTVTHGLKTFPLVDIYQLDYFQVVRADGEDKDDLSDAMVNFFLYHTSEKKQKSVGTPTKGIEIEPT